MDRQAQVDRLLELAQHPAHKRRLPNADVTLRRGNPHGMHEGRLVEGGVTLQGGNAECGDLVVYHIKVGPGERVTAITFEGDGCTISQAAAELVAAECENHTLDEIEARSQDEIIDLLGRDIVTSRPRCASLALNTLKSAVKKYRLLQAHPDA